MNTCDEYIHDFQIDPLSTSIASGTLSKPKFMRVVEALKQFMIKVATHFGADKAIANDDMKDVLMFEKKLYKVRLGNLIVFDSP